DFEDLQWVDEISLEIIGELARRARELPLLIVACYRAEELQPGSFFREWRARLIGQRFAEEVRLAPLTAEQTALMTTLILGTGLPAPREVVAAVHDRTDGIPLHIEELVGALPDEARLDGRRIRDAVVPDTIEDAILARLDQLSPEARQVAGAGAVIGRSFIPEVLAGIMDRPVADLDAPLAELVERSYLNDAFESGWLDFRHQLLRDVLYRTVGPTELRRFHARAAEFGTVLDGQSEIHSSLHYERAGLHAQAFRAALAGAERASRMSARQEAFELYRRAIDHMPDDLPALEQAQLFSAYSAAAGAIEQNRTSIEAAERARAAYLAAGHEVEAIELLLDLASMPAREGRPVSERLASLEEALPLIDRLPAGRERDILRAWFHDFRGFTELDASRIDEATADVRRAIELAEALDDRETILNAGITEARIDILAGRLEEGFRKGLRAAREAREAGFESVGVTGFRNLAISAARVLDYRSAELAIREGVRYADAIEQSHCRQQMAATSALMAWSAGHWDTAETTARQELVERGCRRGVVSVIDVLGLVGLGRGDVPEARRWYDESLEAAEQMEEVAYRLPAMWGLAELDVVAGDPAAAAARCRAALELAIETRERALLVPFVVTGTRAALLANR
ncbi:MAG TPA: hypothetical protein VK194_10970, partial [Candidatus Deferrimicrobium sp.]|nr:hypothetical protein [Candidatus Deferrimicrobium sp.]